MTMLLNAAITTAVAAVVSTPLQLRPVEGDIAQNVGLQANFTYGSGGTSATIWVQTSFDAGATWIDVANFAFATTTALALFNLSALTPVTTQYTATDGTLASNTAKDGLIGSLWRTKLTTVGTYAGSTTLRVDAIALGLTSSP
jgi:hypothetical protein